MGLEPTTSGATDQRSAIELQPPYALGFPHTRAGFYHNSGLHFPVFPCSPKK